MSVKKTDKEDKPEKLEYIVWHDASGADGWVRKSWLIEQGHGVAEIHMVGFLVKEDKDCVTYTMGIDTTNGNYSAFISIPKAWIKSRAHLKGSKLTAKAS